LPKCHRIENSTHGLTLINQIGWVERAPRINFGVVAYLQEATVQKIFLAGIAAAGLFSGSALASDLPAKAPAYKAPIAAPPYNWSGLYVGANFGGGWSNGSLNIPGNNLYGGLSEFIGGVQAGYNFQAGHFLFGFEGEFDGVLDGGHGAVRLCPPSEFNASPRPPAILQTATGPRRGWT
jgi:hypothetical protein